MSRRYYNWEEIEPLFETMTNRQIADKFNMNYRIVANRRNKKQAKKIPKSARYKDLIGKYPDHVVAKMTGLRQNTITRYRIRHNIDSVNSREMIEQSFQKFVAEKTNGVTEYFINKYRIDVLTSDSIIECKVSITREKFYQAIGQLSIYSKFFPEKKLELAYIKNQCVSKRMIADAEEIGIAVKKYDYKHKPK